VKTKRAFWVALLIVVTATKSLAGGSFKKSWDYVVAYAQRFPMWQTLVNQA